MASPLLRLNGIVLGGRDLGESDRLMTFFTREQGKTRAVAKGAKRSRKRFLNSLEPFTVVAMEIAQPRIQGLARLERAEVVTAMPDIAGDYETFALASLLCELTDLWTREDDPSTQIYQLLTWALRALEKGERKWLTALAFQVKMLALSGVAPSWTQCASCQRDISRGTATHAENGFLCRECSEQRGDLSPGLLNALRFLSLSRRGTVQRLAINPSMLQRGWFLCEALHSHHLGKTPRCYEVLRKRVLELHKKKAPVAQPLT